MIIDNLRQLNALPTLETLVCFEAVTRLGSFTRAARELSVTQSAVSKQIKALEEALHCELFDRHARGIQLSPTGAAFLEELEPLLYGLYRLISRVQHDCNIQAVTITCTQAVAHYWLFPRVVRFNQEHPDITVNIVSTNAVNERRCNDCDLGILYGDGEWPSLSSTLVFPEIVYPICSARYEVEAPQSPDDLRKLPLIQVDAREWGWLTWQDWFEHFGLEYEIPRNALTFNQLTLSLEAAIEGVGIGLGWEFMAGPAIAAGRLRKLGDFDFVTGRSDYLVHVKHRHLSSAARTLHDWLLASAEGAGSAAS